MTDICNNLEVSGAAKRGRGRPRNPLRARGENAAVYIQLTVADRTSLEQLRGRLCVREAAGRARAGHPVAALDRGGLVSFAKAAQAALRMGLKRALDDRPTRTAKARRKDAVKRP